MAGILYIVGTPIGNLEDMTFRAIRILKEVEVILAEDTRHTRKLCSHYDISTRLVSYHKFNEAAREQQIVSRLSEGASMALVSDSGMPGISDPGGRIVSACHAASILVQVVPGPSSVVSAVALSGLGYDGFTFLGFLPVKSGRRMKMLTSVMESEMDSVLFESPHRLLKLLNEIVAIDPERIIFVARELTKAFEEGAAGAAAEVQQKFEGRAVKGECVVVVQGLTAQKQWRKRHATV